MKKGKKTFDKDSSDRYSLQRKKLGLFSTWTSYYERSLQQLGGLVGASRPCRLAVPKGSQCHTKWLHYTSSSPRMLK